MTPKDLESKFRWLAKWVSVDTPKDKITGELDAALDAVDDRLDDYRSKLDNGWQATEDEEYEMDCLFRIRSLLVKQHESRVLGTAYFRASPELSLALAAGADALAAQAKPATDKNSEKETASHDDPTNLPIERDRALPNAANMSDPVKDAVEYQRVEWFIRKTREALTADRMDKTAKRGHLVRHKKGGRWHYEVKSVMEYYPEYKALLTS